ncbi:AraC family transcriptional regulator [Sodalis sp. RH14]|uniref:AraC family transcriptional regulator n=1 Tax=Sodalis sp. RH14 TaxID=3394329 RepID=UPI0039B6D2E3
MKSDPLSDILSLLKPDTWVAGGLHLGGDWSVSFDAHSGIKCYAIVSGTAWLAIEGDEAPLLLEAGDCVLLPNGRRFVLARDLAFPPLAFSAMPTEEWVGGIATVNGGGDTMMLAGHFAFTGSHIDLLLGTMPAIIRLRDDSDKVGLRWALERLRLELSAIQPGGVLVAKHLAHLMLIQALRIYLSTEAGRGVGWLFALADPQLAASINAIHAHPGARWTLPALAKIAGMSRSKFAQTFRAKTGHSPIMYLTRWRMLIACRRLTQGVDPVAVIARSLGYESESAFSTAFRRSTGYSPRNYARQQYQAVQA